MNSTTEGLGFLRVTIGYTLIDVTKTGEVSSRISIERNQQRNWETLLQVLGLRAQLISLAGPELRELDMATCKFGKDFTGIHRVWAFSFGVEHDAIFADATTPYGTLETDFVNVPIILGLTETAKIKTPTFTVTGPQQNIYFEQLKI